MRGWQELGVVDTIYEEDQEEEEGFMSPSLSPSPPTTPTPVQSSSPPSPPSLQTRVEAWSMVTGCKPDVVIRVHDQCFHLHKDPIISKSGYLKRRLMESAAIAVSPPAPMSPETFAAIAAFCYGAGIVLTPTNFAGVRIAAEWLEMENLVARAEEYFEDEVAADPEIAAIVLRSCLEMLPEAAAVALVGRCVEVLASVDGGGGGDGGWGEELGKMKAEEFVLIAGTWRARLVRDHDFLYRVVDLYLEKNKEKLDEEDKSRICCMVDCRKLSHPVLLHLVQNPQMPLRFIVQAMLADHLFTRHSFRHLATGHKPPPPAATNATTATANNLTLGEILRRDSAIRQAAHLRASMEATSFRIQSLERDLAMMRQKLRWSEESVRSASFRFFREEEEERVGGDGGPEKCNGSLSNKGGLKMKLLHGLRNVFRGPSRKTSGEGDIDEEIAGEERRPRQRKNRSFA